MSTYAYVPPAACDRAAVRRAFRAYYAATESEPSDVWDRRVIDRLIAHMVSLGKPFSSNDLHAFGMPSVRKCLISRRLIAAQHAGAVHKVGYTPSTLPSTKGAVVAVYAPSPP